MLEDNLEKNGSLWNHCVMEEDGVAIWYTGDLAVTKIGSGAEGRRETRVVIAAHGRGESN